MPGRSVGENDAEVPFKVTARPTGPRVIRDDGVEIVRPSVAWWRFIGLSTPIRPRRIDCRRVAAYSVVP
jgi:hypothetical protein